MSATTSGGSGATTDTGEPSTTSAGSGDAETTSTTDAAPTSGDPSTTSGAGTTSTSGATTSDPGDPGDATGDSASDTASDTGDPEPWAPKPCPSIYAQELLPTFEIEISGSELAALQQEWQIADDHDLAEHPLKSFTYGDLVILDASARLRGNASHWPEQGKMQLEVSFNTYDPKGRFLGLKHVLFDAATYNRSYLRDRLALEILRDVGVPAPCANNARLVLNGEYYGLFTNIEKVDSEFLERVFDEPDGNLYKRGGPGDWARKNNEEDPDESDIDALKAADALAEVVAVMDLEEAILEWATEAVIPDRDGAWGGGLNQYVYHHPKRGFLVIPWDLDDSFTRLPADTDPITYQKEPESFHGRPYYDLALADPEWFAAYIAAVDHVVTTAYNVDVLQARIDAYAAQIAQAAADDPNRPFTLSQHLSRIAQKRTYVADRAKFLETWLACWTGGGTDEDHDFLCEPP
ncbi:MAG: CotH kinase family protein [Nannocystaceae bacterium]